MINLEERIYLISLFLKINFINFLDHGQSFNKKYSSEK